MVTKGRIIPTSLILILMLFLNVLLVTAFSIAPLCTNGKNNNHHYHPYQSIRRTFITHLYQYTNQQQLLQSDTTVSIVVNDDENDIETHENIQQQQQQQQQQRHDRLKAMIQSYKINDDDTIFQPVSWLQNHHIQTIGGYLFRKWTTTTTTLNMNNNNNNNNNNDKIQQFAYIRQNEPWYKTIQNMIQAATTAMDDSNTNNIPQNGSIIPFWDERIRIDTNDNDFFHVDIRYGSHHTDHSDTTTATSTTTNQRQSSNMNNDDIPIVLLLHGLQSNSQSPVCMEMTTAIQQQFASSTTTSSTTSSSSSCHVHCINFRGCSGIPNDTIGGYHLGYTDDLKYYLQYLYQQYQKRQQHRIDNATNSYPPVYMTGFSLGANVVIKCLGELGSTAQQVPYNVHGAAVLCLPFDQVANAPVLAQNGINRYIYTNNLLSSLKKKCTEQYERFYQNNDNILEQRQLFNYTKVMMSQTITEFDDAFIAPVYNYTDCWDYYTQTSSIHYISNVTVPTLILNAKDDPFFNNSIWPTHYSIENNGGKVPIKMIQTDHGGHLGYYFHQVNDITYEQIMQNFRNNNMNHRRSTVVPSWSAMETDDF